MEVTSNGKTEETRYSKQEEADSEVVIKHVEELKPEVESVKEFLADGNSEDLKEDNDGSSQLNEVEPKEESSSLGVDSDKVEAEEVKKEVANSIDEADEVTVPFPLELFSTVEATIESSKDDGMEVESKEVYENESNENPTVVASREMDGAEEPELPSSTSNDKGSLSPIAEDTISKGVEEDVLRPLNENFEVPPALTDMGKGNEEIKPMPSEEKAEGSIIDNKESLKIIDDSLKPPIDETVVRSTEVTPEGPDNPHVISVSQRTVQPTTWKSCCGLFEVLRRSR